MAIVVSGQATSSPCSDKTIFDTNNHSSQSYNNITADLSDESIL